MTNEDTELLLKDIHPRIRHGLMCLGDGLLTVGYIQGEYVHAEEHPKERYHISYIKPCLRPLSSMIEEERNELSDFLQEHVMSDRTGITFPPDQIHGKGIPFEWMSECIDWLNRHMFDYRGLIQKGLAAEAPEWMYRKVKGT